MMKKEEKELIEIKINELKSKLETENSKVKVNEITYYKDFEILSSDDTHPGLSSKTTFVVEREIENKGIKFKYFEMYDDNFDVIGRTDSTGRIEYNKEFLKKLQEKSPEFFKKLGFLERDAYLNKNGEFVVNNNSLDKLTEKEKNNNKDKISEYSENSLKSQEEIQKKADTGEISERTDTDKIEPTDVEQDLGLDKDSITYCVKIKDDRFFDTVPEGRDFARSAFLVYSKELQTFMIVGVKDGKYQPYKTIEPAKSTMKTSANLDREGDNIEEDTITGIMKIKGNNEYSFSVDIEMDGYVEFQQLRRDEKTGEYISADLETHLQYRANEEVERIMDRERNDNITGEIKKFEEKENKSTVTVEDIKDNEKEDEEDGQKVPWDRNLRTRG